MADSSKKSLSKSTLSGFLWLSFQSGGARVISIVTQLLLARFLFPAQFGTISLVYTVTSISSAIVNFGIDGVLLQRHRTFRLWITPAFWTSFALGVVGFLIVALMSLVFARLYHSPQLPGLALILALSMPIGALATIPTVRFRMDMNFRFTAVYTTFELFASQLATVALAATGFGVLSFVLPTPVMALAKAAIYWWRRPSRLGGRMRPIQIKFLLGNGLAIFGSRLSTELISQGDYAVLGLTSTHTEVGIYFFAFRLAVQPLWTVAGNFTNVLFPALVLLKTDPVRQLQAAIKSAKLLAYVAFPACFLQAALAGPFLQVFFGHKWLASIRLVQFLSIGLAFDAARWVSAATLNAKRDFGIGLFYGVFKMPAFFVFVWVGALLDGAYGVALAVMTFYIISAPLVCLDTFCFYGLKPGEVLSIYTRPPLLAGIATGAPFLVSLTPWLLAHPLLRLIVIGAVAVPLYLALLWGFAPEALNDLQNRIGLDRISRRLGLNGRALRSGMPS